MKGTIFEKKETTKAQDVHALFETNEHKVDAALKNMSGNTKFSQVYKVVKPIVELLSNFPLIPAKFRKALKALLEASDAIVN